MRARTNYNLVNLAVAILRSIIYAQSIICNRHRCSFSKRKLFIILKVYTSNKTPFIFLFKSTVLKEGAALG